MNVIALYHKQFKEEIRRRYLSKGETANVHRLMADFFLGTYAEEPKPIKLKFFRDDQKSLMRRVR